MASSRLAKILFFLTPNRLLEIYKKNLIYRDSSRNLYSRESYAQEGEDLVLERFLGSQSIGFYIDIGAHHPKRFSNTYLFYLRGWRGINVDAMPGSMKIFNDQRPEDLNLEVGVSKTDGFLDYFIFNEPALNTFSKDEADRKELIPEYFIQEVKQVQTYPLHKILEKYVPLNTEIDFMSIDVEGVDLEVIKSNNWDLYRPRILLVEDLRQKSIAQILENSEVYHFLESVGYNFIAKTYNTLFFKNCR